MAKSQLTCAEVGITIKQKLNGKWYDVPDNVLHAGTLEQFFAEFGNAETIARMKDEKGYCYFVGTEELLQAYRKRGDRVQLLAAVGEGR